MAKTLINKTTASIPYHALDRTFSDFLKHPEKKVLVLKGKWGVGKTYAWKKFVETNKEFKESAIAYVSLFGVKDLKEVQQLIVQKAVPTNLKQLRSISKVGIPLVNALRNLPVPYLKEALETTDNIAALLVRRFLICFDDIERKSDELSLAEILGLVSVLKEEKDCRIVLIFNEDQIQGEDDKISLRKYREKVVDQEIAYDPFVKDNIRLIFQPNEFLIVQDALQMMAVNNIRIIKFAHWNAKHFEPYTALLESAVRDSLMGNIAILTCLFYMHGDQIDMRNLPLNYFSIMFSKDKEEKLTDAELLLKEAQYSKQDFDPLIVDYLQTGKYDEVELRKVLATLNERELKNKTQQKLASVWGLFNRNFQSTKTEVEKAFTDFVEKHGKELAFGELKQVCDLFTMLGRDEISQKWKTEFIESKITTLTIDEAEFFKSQISNPEILRKISEREKEIQKDTSLKDVIYRMIEQRSWSPKDEAFLNSFSDDEYYKWLEYEKDENLLSHLRGFYQTFVGNPNNEIWKSIGAKLQGALKRLSKRSELDKHRIHIFFNLKE
jgi:hypothetical protein